MDTSNNSVKEKIKEYIQQATFVEKDKSRMIH